VKNNGGRREKGGKEGFFQHRKGAGGKRKKGGKESRIIAVRVVDKSEIAVVNVIPKKKRKERDLSGCVPARERKGGGGRDSSTRTFQHRRVINNREERGGEKRLFFFAMGGKVGERKGGLPHRTLIQTASWRERKKKKRTHVWEHFSYSVWEEKKEGKEWYTAHGGGFLGLGDVRRGKKKKKMQR